MTDKKDHRNRHILLHKMLDELLADFIYHNRGKHLSESSLLDLMEWSHRQTINPDEDETIPTPAAASQKSSGALDL